MSDFDLDAYLRRIGHAGPCTVSFETLAALQRAHTAALPFENLDPLLGRPVALDAASLSAKLVESCRGGWCYEHNLLLGHALRAIGFQVQDLAARVRWNVPAGVVRPRTHMLLLVSVASERHLVDAGFGGLTLTAPLRLDRRSPQTTPHGTFRLPLSSGGYELQAAVAGDWRALYAFDLQPQQAADFEMASWYLCHHPASIFRRSLMAARVLPSGRHTLLDDRLTHHRADGEAQVRRLGSPGELRAVLESVFAIDLAGLSGLDAVLDRLLDRESGAGSIEAPADDTA